jgi:hypothetical protein
MKFEAGGDSDNKNLNETVTVAGLQKALAAMKVEIDREIAKAREEVRAECAKIRAEARAENDKVKVELHNIKTELGTLNTRLAQTSIRALPDLARQKNTFRYERDQARGFSSWESVRSCFGGVADMQAYVNGARIFSTRLQWDEIELVMWGGELREQGNTAAHEFMKEEHLRAISTVEDKKTQGFLTNIYKAVYNA